MNSQHQKDETYPLKLMKYEAEKLGIDFLEHYGIRNFFHNGDVFGITTNKEWNSLTNSEQFTLRTKLHYYDELSFIKKHKMRYIIRTKELASSPFLISLVDVEMCNAIGRYITNEIGLIGYYFTANQNDKEAIHFLVNNVYLFDKVIAAVDNQLIKEGYWDNILILPNNRKLLPAVFFSKEKIDKNLIHRIFFDGKEFVFTQREMQILKIIKIRNVTKEIAQILEVSTRTIEWHIQNLKNKTGLSKKDELVDFALQLEKLIK